MRWTRNKLLAFYGGVMCLRTFMKKIFIFVVFLMSGCATTEKYTVDPNYDEEGLAILYIYRTKTSFHSLNPELPFIYIGEKVAAKLKTGAYKIIKVVPGKHRLSVRQPIAFMPGNESDSFEHEFEAGNAYYIRYSMEFDGAAAIGSSVSVYGSSNFGITNKESFELRR